MKQIFLKITFAILSAIIFYGCSQEPYDWSEGKSVATIKEISYPILQANLIQIKTTLNIKGSEIDSIDLVLRTNINDKWTFKDKSRPSLLENSSNTYICEFSNLTANTQYKITILIWTNGSTNPNYEKEEYVTTPEAMFTLQTNNAEVRNQHVAELYGSFTSEEIEITKDLLGFIISENEYNIKENELRPCLELNSDGSFSTVVDGLKPGTNYYYVACFIKEEKQYFGETKSFRTLDVELTEGDYIDLGLDVLWASCNLNANSPEECGGYYNWGNPINSTETNKSFKIISGTGYDAAFHSLGTGYRIPSDDEWSSLLKECTWEWITYKEVDGYLVTGKNGNSIFIPAISDNYNYQGYYYVGTQNSYVYNYTAQRITISESKHIFENNMSQELFSIRPVKDERVYCETNKEATNITVHTADVTGSFRANENVDECGIWYGTTEYPHPEEGKIKKMDEIKDIITITLSGLLPQTVYYYATYAKIGDFTYFGNVEKFTTENGDISEEITTDEEIDLGLSVLWRGYNLKSTSPEEFGDKFSFYYSTNRPNIISGTQYDPTVYELGNNWRTPKPEEIKELLEQCSWIKQTYKGIEGWQVIGPTNKSIFLPINTSTETINYYLSGQLFWDGLKDHNIEVIKLTQNSKALADIKSGTLGYIRPVKDK